MLCDGCDEHERAEAVAIIAAAIVIRRAGRMMAQSTRFPLHATWVPIAPG
jgi:hypothetical protein